MRVLARELINRVQKLRKDFGFEVSDRIVLRYMTTSPKLVLAFAENKKRILEEILAVEMEEGDTASLAELGEPSMQEIENEKLVIAITRMQG